MRIHARVCSRAFADLDLPLENSSSSGKAICPRIRLPIIAQRLPNWILVAPGDYHENADETGPHEQEFVADDVLLREAPRVVHREHYVRHQLSSCLDGPWPARPTARGG